MLYFRVQDGKRIYTLDPNNSELAYPAKYSLEDNFSHERIVLKKRNKIYPFDI